MTDFYEIPADELASKVKQLVIEARREQALSQLPPELRRFLEQAAAAKGIEVYEYAAQILLDHLAVSYLMKWFEKGGGK